MQKIALVTGANKGIGLEVCRQLAEENCIAILTSRDEEKGREAVKNLGKDTIVYHQLDVTDEKSIEKVKKFIEEEYGRLDILINNAGVHLESWEKSGVDDANIDVIKEIVNTNTYGPLRMIKAFLPLMKKNHFGRIVNVSSGMGQLADMGTGSVGYRLSKTALNAITKIAAAECQGLNIKVNSVCPGWVRTDMGGMEAPRSTEQGAETIVWAALLPDNGPTGKFFRDKKEIAW